MKLPIVDTDLHTGTWQRIRLGLIQNLWTARAQLETPGLTEVETACIRERIRFVKELLSADPKKDDYLLPPRAMAAGGL